MKLKKLIRLKPGTVIVHRLAFGLILPNCYWLHFDRDGVFMVDMNEQERGEMKGWHVGTVPNQDGYWYEDPHSGH